MVICAAYALSVLTWGMGIQDPNRMLIRLVRQTFAYQNRQFACNTVIPAPRPDKFTARPEIVLRDPK
eukprot:2150083-Rhodomonas_salina.1